MKAVIFDVDGTLIDSVDLHARAWVDALQHFGFRIPFEDLRVQIGKGGDELLKGLLPPGVVDDKGEEIQQFRSDLFQREYLPKVRAFPGVRELFERINAAGSKVVLASSGKAEEVKRYTQIAGITDLIDDATSSDDAERSKPFPDIFRAALARLAPIAAREALVVGDTPYDAEAARSAGMKSVGVLCGGFSEESLRSAGCIAIYRDAADLLADYEASPLASMAAQP